MSQTMPCQNLPPRDYERFVGRQKELEEVRRLLLPYPKSRHHLVTIDGIGGIGKSALALETAYTFREGSAALPEVERFDAIVWVSAKRTYLTADGILQQRQAFRALDDLYAAIAQVLDYPAITRAPAEEQRAIVEQVLRERRTLLILDNLETVDDEELLAFLRLLPDPTKAIVTTRHRIDVAYPVRLTGLPHADALALIAQEAARKGVELALDKQEELWRRTGGVPLAIVWSIGLIGLGARVEGVLRRLGSGQNDIAHFCFDESVAQIRGRDTHRLLLALSLFEASVSRTMLGQVAGLGADEFGRDEGLTELLRLSLVNKDGDRFSLLPLTRAYALEELARLPELERAIRNEWVAYLTSFARPYGAPNWRRPDRGWLRREGGHLVTLLVWSQQAGRPDIWVQILPAVSSYYNITGQWTERLNLGQLGLDYARLIGDMQSIVAIEARTLGWVLTQQGHYKEAEAYITDALGVARRMGDVEWQCEVLIRFSRLLRRADKFDQAADCCRQARQLLSLLEEPQRQVFVRADIEYEQGRIARDRGDWAAARAYFLAAREVFHHDDQNPVFNIERAWGVLANLGLIAHHSGDLDGAIQIYLQCLEFFKESGSKQYIIFLLIHLAALEEQRGRVVAARGYAGQALESSQQLGMTREQAEAVALLARLGGGATGAPGE